jgi:hypothetical protein
MGQPPQRGHFTSRVSVSITVAAPKFWAPWIDNDQEMQMVPARYGHVQRPLLAFPTRASAARMLVLADHERGLEPDMKEVAN